MTRYGEAWREPDPCPPRGIPRPDVDGESTILGFFGVILAGVLFAGAVVVLWILT